MNKNKKDNKKKDKYDFAELLYKGKEIGKKAVMPVLGITLGLVSNVIRDKFKKD